MKFACAGPPFNPMNSRPSSSNVAAVSYTHLFRNCCTETCCPAILTGGHDRNAAATQSVQSTERTDRRPTRSTADPARNFGPGIVSGSASRSDHGWCAVRLSRRASHPPARNGRQLRTIKGARRIPGDRWDPVDQHRTISHEVFDGAAWRRGSCAGAAWIAKCRVLVHQKVISTGRISGR